ncbi:MAG TPA: transposase [Balneolaceae bacterium]|nr:transposase [Balneolaceae bacterium]
MNKTKNYWRKTKTTGASVSLVPRVFMSYNVLNLLTTFIKMSRKYKIYDQNRPYFITSTIVNWIDLFTRNEYRNVLIESLNYCRQNKGLLLYAYCIMTNHVHLIVGRKEKKLESIIRDFKSFTSRELRKTIEKNAQESRKEWILEMMYKAGLSKGSNKDFQLWQHHYHPIELSSEYLFEQKLDYIHLNPVKAGFVNKAEDYLYSSAKNYAGLQGIIELDVDVNYLSRAGRSRY